MVYGRRVATPEILTPNQVVAYNLARARRLKGWTQEEARRALSPFIGEEWSKATYSAAERSVAGERVRQFTLDDVFAFARAFDLPWSWFLLPPGDEESEVPRIVAPDVPEGLSPAVFLEVLFRFHPAVGDRLRSLFSEKKIPEGTRTKIQRDVAETTAAYIGAHANLGELDKTERELRNVADRLGAVRGLATGAIAQIAASGGDPKDALARAMASKKTKRTEGRK